MTIERKLCQLIADQKCIPVTEILPEKSFANDLEFGSLDNVTLIVDAEELFDIEIDDDEAEKIITVEDAIAYIKSKTEVATT